MTATYFSSTGKDVSSHASLKIHFDNSIETLVGNTFSEHGGGHTCTTSYTLKGKHASLHVVQAANGGWTLSALQTLRSVTVRWPTEHNTALHTFLGTVVATLHWPCAAKTDGSNECCRPPLVKDPGGHTFCHTPRILATSDLLAVHLNHHVAADHCQRHLLLELEKKDTIKLNSDFNRKAAAAVWQML